MRKTGLLLTWLGIVGVVGSVIALAFGLWSTSQGPTFRYIQDRDLYYTVATSAYYVVGGFAGLVVAVNLLCMGLMFRVVSGIEMKVEALHGGLRSTRRRKRQPEPQVPYAPNFNDFNSRAEKLMPGSEVWVEQPITSDADWEREVDKLLAQAKDDFVDRPPVTEDSSGDAEMDYIRELARRGDNRAVYLFMARARRTGAERAGRRALDSAR